MSEAIFVEGLTKTYAGKTASLYRSRNWCFLTS